VNTTRVNVESLAGPLATIERARLGSIPAELSARVVRRIVDNESLAPRLDVAAFNSAS
jgi:FXSXX-COOH protein